MHTIPMHEFANLVDEEWRFVSTRNRKSLVELASANITNCLSSNIDDFSITIWTDSFFNNSKKSRYFWAVTIFDYGQKRRESFMTRWKKDELSNSNKVNKLFQELSKLDDAKASKLLIDYWFKNSIWTYLNDWKTDKLYKYFEEEIRERNMRKYLTDEAKVSWFLIKKITRGLSQELNEFEIPITMQIDINNNDKSRIAIHWVQDYIWNQLPLWKIINWTIHGDIGREVLKYKIRYEFKNGKNNQLMAINVADRLSRWKEI